MSQPTNQQVLDAILALGKRFDTVLDRLDRVDGRVETLTTTISRLDKRLCVVERKVRARAPRLAEGH